MSNKNAVILTAEQKAKIEANRKQALERLKVRNLEGANSSSKSITKILPTKADASSHRVNPYLQPQQSRFSNNYQSSPQTPGKATSSLSNNDNNSKPPQRNVHCFIELISEDRFLVKTNAYDDKIIQEFKKVPSSTYRKSS